MTDKNTEGVSTVQAVAIIALIIAVVALLWAIKADMRASNAWDKADSIQNSTSTEVKPNLTEDQSADTEPSPSGVDPDGNNTILSPPN